MSIIRWDPWGDIATMQRDMARILDRANERTAVQGSLVPAIDAYETDDGVVVHVELPGLDPADVEISVADGQLTISGTRLVDAKIGEDAWLRRERAYGTFARSFSLPEGTDADLITADFEHGVLTLRVPHPPEKQPRRIPISATA